MQTLDLISRYSTLLIYPGAALLAAAVLTKFCIRLFPRLGMLDLPRGRHLHDRPVPVGGGIAIVLSFFAVGTVYSLNFASYTGDMSVLMLLLRFLPSAAVITVTGILDDRFELQAKVKLLAQILAAVLVFFCSNGICAVFGIPLPWWLSLPLTVLWVVVIVNAFNLIDGLDGLAAGLAAISGFSVAVWMLLAGNQTANVGIVLVFCAACLGFLRYNFSPAKIFLGDTGSMFLGLFFAYWGCSRISQSVTMLSLLLPLLAIGVPVFDVFLAIWRRGIRKLMHPGSAAGIMTGDCDHLHHWLLRKTGSKSKAALLLYLIAAAFSICGFLIAAAEHALPGIVFFILLVVIYRVIKLADLELLDSFGLVVSGLARPQRRLLLIAIHPIIDLGILSASFCGVFLLCLSDRAAFPLLATYTVLVAPFPLALCCSGVYRTYWLRAGINRYYQFFKIFALTAILDLVLFYLIRDLSPEIRGTRLFAGLHWKDQLGILLLFYLAAAAMLAGERFMLRYLESFGLRNFYLRTHPETDEEPMKNTLIVGGGLACRLYIESLFCRYYFRQPFRIVGIADDDRAIRHLNVYGFPVLGSTADLETLHELYRIDHVVMTAVNLSPEALERVADFCRKYDIPVSVYRLSDMPCLVSDIYQLAAELRACGEGTENRA